jgi:primosomal protein N' (replication factor Y)
MLPPGISVKAVKNIKLILPENKMAFKKSNMNKIVDNLACVGGECEYEQLRGMCEIKGFKGYIQELCECGTISIEECYEQKVNAKSVKVVCLAKSNEEIIEELENNAIKRIQHISVLEI